ncbi:unnamed protein product [Pleuronectes platessa]|uniref:Uncharacterized protein n=1 Tax=Pleuronectes platessa TaxID=8262 RepID=A0A9N7YC26_PLEPL|nr:unnamed protein product [Pleuronectes platessa]
MDVKYAIFRKYAIPETKRQRFRSAEVEPGETPKELYGRLKKLYGGCSYAQSRLDKHIRETHTEMSISERASSVQVAKRWQCLKLLRELRDWKPFHAAPTCEQCNVEDGLEEEIVWSLVNHRLVKMRKSMQGVRDARLKEETARQEQRFETLQQVRITPAPELIPSGPDIQGLEA